MDDQTIRIIRKLRVQSHRIAAAPRPRYLENTWTPTYTGSVTAGVTTYTTQQGGWIRHGAVVTVTGTIVWTAATGTGNVRINLPFTPVNSANQNYGGGLYTNGVTWANTGIVWFIAPNVALLRLFSPASNAASTEVAIEAAGEVRFTCTYFTLA